MPKTAKIIERQIGTYQGTPVIDKDWCCPECGGLLLYHDSPSYIYCPDCKDVAYHPETGLIIGRVE